MKERKQKRENNVTTTREFQVERVTRTLTRGRSRLVPGFLLLLMLLLNTDTDADADAG